MIQSDLGGLNVKTAAFYANFDDFLKDIKVVFRFFPAVCEHKFCYPNRYNVVPEGEGTTTTSFFSVGMIWGRNTVATLRTSGKSS